MRRTLDEIDTLPALPSFLIQPANDTVTTSDRAYRLWSQTDLAAYRLTSSVELYAADGRNFLTTMLRLMASRPQLTVVSDQIGAPTSVVGLAQVLWAFTRRRATGVYHWCDSGVASWYDFAVAIAEEAASMPDLLQAKVAYGTEVLVA